MSSSRGRQFVVLVVLALAATLSPVSIDLLTPSLPDMASGLGASPQTIELTIYSFLIGYGAAPLLWGKLSDKHGRRPVMFVGMGIYCCSTLACVFVEDIQTMIALRLIQGMGGGAGATMARAVIRDLYGVGGTTKGMANMISLMSVVPFLMPLLGGWLAQTFSWSTCFIAMVAIGTLSVVSYIFLVPESRPVQTAALGEARFTMFGIVKHPVFAQHCICNMFGISTLVIFATNYSFITTEVFQLSNTQNGLVLSLFNGSIALGTYVVHALMPKFGSHRSILVGTKLCVLGWLWMAALAATGNQSLLLLAPGMIGAAIGSGIIMALCSGGALIPFSRDSGTASSLYLLIQSLGASAISLLVGLFLGKQLLLVILALVFCSAMAMLSKILLTPTVASDAR